MREYKERDGSVFLGVCSSFAISALFYAFLFWVIFGAWG